MLSLARAEDWAEVQPRVRDDVRELLEDGGRRVKAGQFTAAIDDCLRVLVLSPEFLPAQARLAEIYVARGDLGLAEAKYSTITDVCLLRGRLDQGLEAHQQWLELASEDAARNRLVRLLLNKAAAGLALHLFTGATYLKARRSEEALREYREAVAAFPTSALAREWLGRALGSVGLYSAAAAEFAVALRTDPDNPALLAESCIAHISAGNQPGAQSSFQHLAGVLTHHRDRVEWALLGYQALPWPRASAPDFSLWLGLFLLGVGHLEVALDCLQRSAGHARTRLAARWGLAQYHLAVGDPGAALQELRGIQGPVPGQGRVLVPLVEVQLGTPKWEAASQVIRELQRLDPDDETLLLKAAEAHFKRGRLAESLQFFSALATLYERQGQAGRAEEVRRIMAQLGTRTR